MMTFIQFVILFCAGSISQSALCSSAVEKALKRAEIVPDVIENAPANLVNVKYGEHRVHLGNVLTPTQTKNAPEVSYPSKAQAFYLLCMTDPDIPSRENPIYREFKHWLVGNIPGDKVEKGDILAEYMTPAPPKGNGFHRYTFLVYSQPDGKIDYAAEGLSSKSKKNRTNFHIEDFAEKYNLGEPIAANFFKAQYDSYVDVVQENLSGN